MKASHKKMARSAMRSQGARLGARYFERKCYPEAEERLFKSLYRWYIKFR